MNRIGQLLSFILAFVLCYSQLVASTHFVEHLPKQSHSNAGRAYDASVGVPGHTGMHSAWHAAERSGSHLAEHASFHDTHHDASSSQSHPFDHIGGSSEHDERNIADCSIYHFYAGLNGLVQARADTPCALYDHVITPAVLASPHSQTIAYHRPIRAPPPFS